MKNKETKICPYCGGISKFLCFVNRTVRSEYGEIKKIKVKRFKCGDCGKTFRDLPDYLSPYKQFRADIIDGFVEGNLSTSNLKYEDYPSEQTIKRWKKEKHDGDNH